MKTLKLHMQLVLELVRFNASENKTAKYLDRFHYLSSREKSGTNIIKQLTGRDVPVVVDPYIIDDTPKIGRK